MGCSVPLSVIVLIHKQSVGMTTPPGLSKHTSVPLKHKHLRPKLSYHRGRGDQMNDAATDAPPSRTHHISRLRVTAINPNKIQK